MIIPQDGVLAAAMGLVMAGREEEEREGGLLGRLDLLLGEEYRGLAGVLEHLLRYNPQDR